MSECGCAIQVVDQPIEVTVTESGQSVIEVDAEPSVVTVIEQAVETVVVQEPSLVVVSDCVGMPGPPGPAGIPGGSWYYHEQNVPSSNWIIVHNLNNWVHCTLMNDAHETIFADVVRTDANTVTITFPSPVTGSAYLS